MNIKDILDDLNNNSENYINEVLNSKMTYQVQEKFLNLINLACKQEQIEKGLNDYLEDKKELDLKVMGALASIILDTE